MPLRGRTAGHRGWRGAVPDRAAGGPGAAEGGRPESVGAPLVGERSPPGVLRGRQASPGVTTGGRVLDGTGEGRQWFMPDLQRPGDQSRRGTKWSRPMSTSVSRLGTAGEVLAIRIMFENGTAVSLQAGEDEPGLGRRSGRGWAPAADGRLARGPSAAAGQAVGEIRAGAGRPLPAARGRSTWTRSRHLTPSSAWNG